MSTAAERRSRAAPARPPRAEQRREAGPGFTIITGLSGAGRSEAARCLEDLEEIRKEIDEHAGRYELTARDARVRSVQLAFFLP